MPIIRSIDAWISRRDSRRLKRYLDREWWPAVRDEYGLTDKGASTMNADVLCLSGWDLLWLGLAWSLYQFGQGFIRGWKETR